MTEQRNPAEARARAFNDAAPVGRKVRRGRATGHVRLPAWTDSRDGTPRVMVAVMLAGCNEVMPLDELELGFDVPALGIAAYRETRK